jgi:signal transduction histidine kinase
MFNPLACNWEDASFLTFSANVTEKVIYYSHYGPLLLVVAMFFFILVTNRREHLSKVLMSVLAFMSLWIVTDLYPWFAVDSDWIMFSWAVLVFFEVSIYLSVLYFVYVFVEGKAPAFWVKLLGVGFYGVIAALLPTAYTLNFFDIRDCGREAIEGPVILYSYIPYLICIALVLLVMLYGLWQYSERRREILLVGLGASGFLGVFFSGLIIGSITSDWLLSQIGLFVIPIFTSFLIYLVARHDQFSHRLASVQFIVASIILFIGAQLFFVEETLGVVLIVSTLVLAVIFSIVMSKVIQIELKRKEDLQELTTSLTTANKQLKELDNAKTEFLSIASHQLRTPLTAIKGYISLILEGSYGEVSASVQDVLNKLYLVNSRMVNLAEDLLNVSRIDAGRVQYNYHKVVLEKVLQEAVEVFRLTAQEKGLTLTLTLPDNPLPEMTIDARKIQEVCSNLIDNSIKYTKEGSVAVSLVALQDRAMITVQDTGIGIQPENKDKLFAKFVRSKETNILDVSGTGLGLYVGKNFVEAHGGTIRAESDGKDKGSQFIIELPYINPKLNQTAPNWMINS